MLLGLLAYLPLSHKIKIDCIFQAELTTNHLNTTISLQHNCDFDAGVSVWLMSGTDVVEAIIHDFSLLTRNIYVGLPVNVSRDSISLMIEDIGYYTIFMIREAYRLVIDWNNCMEISNVYFGADLCFEMQFCNQIGAHQGEISQRAHLSIFHNDLLVFGDEQASACFPITDALSDVLRRTPLLHQLEITGSFDGLPTRLVQRKFTYEIVELNDFEDVKLVLELNHVLIFITMNDAALHKYDAHDEYNAFFFAVNTDTVWEVPLSAVAREMVIRMSTDADENAQELFIIKLAAYRGREMTVSFSQEIHAHYSCNNAKSALQVFSEHSVLLPNKRDCNYTLNAEVLRVQLYSNGYFVASASVEHLTSGNIRLIFDKQHPAIRLNNFETVTLAFLDASGEFYDVVELNNITVEGSRSFKFALHFFCGILSVTAIVAVLIIAICFWRLEKFDLICTK